MNNINVCLENWDFFWWHCDLFSWWHYGDVIMSTIVSQITSLTIVYSTVYSGADQRKHQSSASLAFVRGIHRRPVNSPHKGPVTRKMFPFDYVIMMSWHGNAFHITGPLWVKSTNDWPVILNIDVFYIVRLNKLLFKQSCCRWIQMI